MPTHTQRAARRQALGSTCLLALPAALAIGTPAQAQTIITTSQTSPFNLSAYGGPVSIASGVSITSTGVAAISGGTAAQLANAGLVADAAGAGISLGAGGSLTNTGGISGADAVRLGAGGSIANTGAINGTGYGVLVNNGTGIVTNSGAIAAGYDGVSLNKGGTITNAGSIFGGHIGVYTGNGLGVVSNSGTISASSGDAVSLYSGGSLTNNATGELLGGYTGVYAGGSGAQITNAGLITGPDFGVYLMGASSVSNSGTIAGGIDGMMDLGAGGQISNSGLIHGGQMGVRLAANGAVENSGIISGGSIGVKLGVNGTLADEASGRIAGGVISVVAAAGDALQNAGTISGPTGIAAAGGISLTNTGVIASTVAGGNAISLSGGASTVILGTGAEIEGNIAANNTASQIELTGSGTLDSNLIGFGAGSAVAVAQGAVWAGSGQWQVARLVNDGVFTPGAIGTPLSLTGNFVQNADGTLRVLVSPGGISPFAITGTASLGGTLRYVLAPGTYQPASDTFLTATGGVNGSFAQITASGTGPRATPTQLTVHGAYAPAAQPAGVPVAAVVTASGASLSISGVFTVAPAGARLFADTTQAMAMGAFASGGTLLERAGSSAPAGGWAQATGGLAMASGAYTTRGGGFMAGLDHGDGFGGRIGFAAGYDSVSLSEDGTGTAGLRTTRLGLYAMQPVGRFRLSADIMGGIAARNTTRGTGAAASATAQGSGHTIAGDVRIALPLTYAGAQFTPAFGLQVASITAGKLDESAATQAFAVKVAGASFTTAAPYLRLRVSRNFITATNLVITPGISLGMSAMLSNPGAAAYITARDGTGFMAKPAHLSPLAGQFGAGIGIGRGNWRVMARYSVVAGGNWSGQILQAGVLVRF